LFYAFRLPLNQKILIKKPGTQERQKNLGILDFGFVCSSFPLSSFPDSIHLCFFFMASWFPDKFFSWRFVGREMFHQVKAISSCLDGFVLPG